MKIEKCFENRLLRKIPVDLEKVKSSLEVARDKLVRSRKLFDSSFFDSSFLQAYTSMFHSARTLLYRDGVQGKSHYAVYVYISEKYFKLIPRSLIESFNNFRSERHEILYGFISDPSKEEILEILSQAESFLMEVEKIIYG
ncbi:MAG: HEPN domain-containing protein [Nanoarchaeota archaeon]|jgi:uncharacterized protein (UPF0332 family)|nr:HEPN domain-containing protein [Nanoarchaeota archaeon]